MPAKIFETCLFLIIWLLKPCHGANTKCNETQCKLVIVGNDLPSEFRSKSTEAGVRMVYFNLTIGNKSYNPLQSYDKLQPNKWTWARDIGEPMLSFSYQYQVLSLGLLSNQVRNMEVLLIEEPTGCLVNLTSSCKDIVVGRTLLQDITVKETSKSASHSKDVVCSSIIKRDIHWLTMWFNENIDYHCCNKEKQGNETWVWCDHPAKRSNWFIVFNIILLVVYFFTCLFWPVPALTVSDCLFKNNENERHKGHFISDEIPVDDLSPITCSILLNKCVKHFTTTGNFFKLFCFHYIFILLPVYLFLTLQYTLVNEIEAKNAFRDVIFINVFDIKNKLHCLLIALVLFVILPGMFIFYTESEPHYDQIQNAVRKNLKLLPKSISYHESGFIDSLKTINKSFHGPYKITRTSLNHLDSVYDKNSTNRYASKVWKILFYLNYVFAIVIYVTLFLLYAAIYGIVGAISLMYFLSRSVIHIICYSPAFTINRFLTIEFVKVVKRFSDGKKSPETVQQNPKESGFSFLYIFSYLISFLWVSYFAILSYLCSTMYTQMFGFVIMGLIINAQRTTPYVIFTYVLINNISTSYNNFQNRFKEVKEIISKHWIEKAKASSLQKANISANTIPRDLFWFVCDKRDVLPLKQEARVLVVFTLMILSILLLAFTTILFFGEEYNNSPLISAAAVLLSGKIPDMLFKGLSKRERVQGWDKIHKEEKIEEAVNDFIQRKEIAEKSSFVLVEPVSWESSV